MAGHTASRRKFIKAMGAGALATGIGCQYHHSGAGPCGSEDAQDPSVGSLRPGLRRVVQREVRQGMGREERH